MPVIIEEEWLAIGETTKWPFSEAASLVNSAGDSLGNSLFVDASIYPAGLIKGAFISSITVDGELVKIQIGEESRPLCSVTFDKFAPPSRLAMTDVYGRPAGLLLGSASSLYAFQAWADGEYKFLRVQTEFAGGVCIPRPEQGVTGIVLSDGELFTGEVNIVAGNGVVIEAGVELRSASACGPLLPVPVTTVHVVGDPLHVRNGCNSQAAAGLFSSSNPLRELVIIGDNAEIHMTPDSSGGITITDGSLLTSRPSLVVHTSADGFRVGFVVPSLV